MHRKLSAAIFGLVFFSCLLGSVLMQPARAEGQKAASTADVTQVVRLHVSRRQVDTNAPWQFEDVVQQSFLGIVVGKDLILTTAYAVDDAALIEMQRLGSSRRDEMRADFVDDEVNLALIKPVSPQAMAGLTPVVLGEELGIDEAVEIDRLRDAYELGRMPATLAEIGVFSSFTSSYSLVSYLLKVQHSGLGWGEPVFRRGKLMAMCAGQDANFVHAIPAPIIRHFMHDRASGRPYRGFPAIGVTLSPLTSPDQRQKLGAVNLEGGVRISEVEAGGPFSKLLQIDDVLRAVDGKAISEHGFYQHPKWGKVHLKYLLNEHFAGDHLRLTIRRGSRDQDVDAVLERFNSNATPVVDYRHNQLEPHLIVGGFVFQELSQAYLRQWGHDWRQQAPMDLLFTFLYENKQRPTPGQRVIFLSRLLADEFNRGYDELRHLLVDSVNGMPVQSMAELNAALRQPQTRNGVRYEVVRFRRDGGEVVLSVAGLAACHKRLAETYEIKTPSSFFTF